MPTTTPDPPEVVKLLLVDDREEDLAALRMTLGDPGYELVMVRSGAEALKHVLLDDFAVILLDVMLPGMDGFEVARLVQHRERSKDTPVLFLTAMGGEMNYIYRAYSSGAVNYLTKPIQPDVVRAKVAVFANLFRKDRRIRRQAEALREAERRQRELELSEVKRSSERRYKNLADAIPAIVWTARTDGALQYANRAWHTYTGLDREQSRAWGWLTALHPDERGRVEATWRHAVGKQGALTVEALLRGRDGEHRSHIIHAVPERDPDGEVVGWLGTMVNCEDLRQAIHARDQFLATASHELRTPLTTLGLAIHSLKKLVGEEPAGEQHKRMGAKVEMAQRQMDRLERLVTALLDVTRIGSGRPVIDRQRCDVGAIVREAVDRLAEEARRAGCSMEVRANGAPVGGFDPLRIDQAVTNLLTNAIHYGAGKPIDVLVEEASGRVRIAVKDLGCGIAPEDLARLFGRFERIASESHQSGLGLGLFISRHLVRAHGGDIRVESELGHGSVFTIDLPLDTAWSVRPAAVGERASAG